MVLGITPNTKFVYSLPGASRDLRLVLLIQSCFSVLVLYFTRTFTTYFFLPDLTVILAVPFFFARITPLEVTVATFLLEEL